MKAVIALLAVVACASAGYLGPPAFVAPVVKHVHPVYAVPPPILAKPIVYAPHPVVKVFHAPVPVVKHVGFGPLAYGAYGHGAYGHGPYGPYGAYGAYGLAHHHHFF